MTPAYRLLLCTDLDRTLLPNGAQQESPGRANCSGAWHHARRSAWPSSAAAIGRGSNRR